MDFSQIALLLVVAGVFGVIAKLFKQPLLIGYLFAGFVLAYTGFVHESPSLESMGQVGVALLLFLLGLEMNLRDVKSIGKVAFLTGLGQIVFTSGIGYILSRLLGFGLVASVYIAIALTFSSTIIMVKLLSEKNDLSSLYGKIAVGFLLVQDLVAVIILIFLAGVGRGISSTDSYLLVAGKAFGLLFTIWFLSKYVLHKFFDRLVAGSNELIFIVSIAWALGVASFVAGPMGFSLEIGGFLAGLALSTLPEHLQIASKARPLRDFFLTIFFILLGTKLVIDGNILAIFPQATLLSVFVLVGNPIIMMAIMGLMGYKKRTSFLVGLTVAQISEFSLILMNMGFGLGHIDATHVALVVLIGVVTMTVSTYLITGADKVYNLISHRLSIFERRTTKEQALTLETKKTDHIVLVGAHRTGGTLTSFFIRRNINFLVVDFNPEVFTKLTADKIDVVFGDVNDPDVFNAANIEKSRMIISTTSNLNDNVTLLENIHSLKKRPVTILTASSRHDAIRLYELKADYLIVPEVIAGEHLKHIVDVYGSSKSKISKLGKSHFNRLLALR